MAPTAVDAVAVCNARVVTEHGVLDDAVVHLEEGRIAALSASVGSAPAVDWGGDLLMPGLVDVHTDNLERHFMPRPGAAWDPVGAAIAHDGQTAAAGVTTVFDSISLHGVKDGLDRGRALPEMIGGVDDARRQGLLRVEHLLHLRCEVSADDLVPQLASFVHHPQLCMLSVMDHTPGQGQYRDLESLRARLLAAGKGEAEIAAEFAEFEAARDPQRTRARRRAVSGIARDRGIALASHDDAEPADVRFAAEIGCDIAEFPVTEAAARAAREAGMVTVLGAPNFVRGGSHSGNVSVRDLAEAELVDAICSDYVPLSMVRVLFQLTEPPFGWPLHRAVALGTTHAARLAGLEDRGTVAPGQRADLLRVRHTVGRWPLVAEVWCAGRRVA